MPMSTTVHTKPDRLRTGLLRGSSNTKLIPMKRFRDKYTIQLNIGFPPQSVSLIVDMNSSNCFASVESRALYREGIVFRQSFEREKSRTFEPVDALFACEFEESSMVYGEIGQDYVRIGDSKPLKMEFGLARYYDDQYAFCGLGIYNPDEFGSGCPEKILQEANFLYQLKAKGSIIYKAYSMWLASSDSDSAAIVFGGLDLARLGSSLYRFPMIGLHENASVSLAIKLDAINIYDSLFHLRVAETSLPIRFDINSKISTLPAGLLRTFYDALGVEKLNGFYSIPCEYMNHDDFYIGLVFSGVEYVFTFQDISEPIDFTGENCAPGFWPGEPVLGSNILQNLYVVYDLEKYELGIAQAYASPPMPPRYYDLTASIPAPLAPFYSSSICNYGYNVHSFSLNKMHTISNVLSTPLLPLDTQSITESLYTFNPRALVTLTFSGR